MMKHKIPVEWMQRYESEAFARETTCSGPLGAAYTPEATTFRLWTPLAEAVSVNLYPHGNGGGRPEVHPMEREVSGLHPARHHPVRGRHHLHPVAGRKHRLHR